MISSLMPTAFAQTQTTTTTTHTVSPTQDSTTITKKNGIYFYQVNVVHRDLDAVNYLHRSGSTKIGFRGTSLLPNARGEAKVQSERGRITIDASFKGLTPANGFGPGYLTYVLWAITPDGRATNLGEVLPAGTKNDIHVTTAAAVVRNDRHRRALLRGHRAQRRRRAAERHSSRTRPTASSKR